MYNCVWIGYDNSQTRPWGAFGFSKKVYDRIKFNLKLSLVWLPACGYVNIEVGDEHKINVLREY